VALEEARPIDLLLNTGDQKMKAKNVQLLRFDHAIAGKECGSWLTI